LFLCRHRSTHWMAGHDVYYKKTKREQTIRRRQSRTKAILFSFPFVGVVQPTGWQGNTSTTKEWKENDQAVTIDKSSDPVLSSFRRRCSTHWMAGHDVYYKRTKREWSGCHYQQEQRSCSLFLS
jgi:uncharacterized protein YcfJ